MSKADQNRCGVATLLSVPHEVIFLKIQDRPILTRREAQCVLRIAVLAREIENLIRIAKRLLQIRRSHGSLLKKAGRLNNPIFRSGLILRSLLEHMALPSFEHLKEDLNCRLSALATCSETMKHSAEQNWNLSESLLEALGKESDQSFAQAKRSLAEVEDELSRRIDHLLSSLSSRSRGSEAKRRLFQQSLGDLGLKTNLRDFCGSKFDALDKTQESLSSRDSPTLADGAVVHSNLPVTQPQTENDVGPDPEQDSGVELTQNSVALKSTAATMLVGLAKSKYG